ncbi:hypothetical protein Agub_g1105 [Astrephomene gubernaculifera]|uniref:Uncharacterized protein n=1 Tax=Astrephomene gubernaculifera TaxID=47775 RepID=A0AAD3HH77_9CHLO|nr:hypothetical protein Agub_g1105 [Astrephomene gubernaculifera]
MCRSPDLGLHPAVLEGLLEDACLARGQPSASVLRAHRYSPDAPADSLAFAPHHDRGVLTLVASNQVRGLQVQQRGSGAEGGWVDVPLGPGRVAVLAGYSLSYALGGLLQPVLHRVLPCSDAAGRVSVTFELCCRPSALVDPEAILREAACRPPEGSRRPRAMHATELMELFEHTHPRSVNGRHLGVGGGAGAAAEGGAGVDAGAAGRPQAQPADPGSALARDPNADGAPQAAPAAIPSSAVPAAEREPGAVGNVQRAGDQGGPATAALAAAKRLRNDPAGPCGAQQQPATAAPAVALQPLAQPPTQPQPPPECITIDVKCCVGRVEFKVKPGTRFYKMIEAFARVRGVAKDHYRFVFDGHKLDPNDTVAEAGLMDGDIIDAFCEQTGS